MLEIRNVTKRFGSTTALDKVDLSIDPKLTHVFLGSSGSGKSTLLRAILGLIACDEGKILFNGEPVAAMTARNRSRRMGYVPQESGLFPHLTARANASIVARAAGWRRDLIDARIRELAGVLSLETDLLDRFPSELSGGQRQRIAVMRATFVDPDLLIFDEPLGALDPLIRSDLQSELRETFVRLRKTVVFVTHDIGEA
ncbi:MAG: ATP-binding cassette domain-containing protein, partial [Bdellovibrionota bacterium]